MSTACEHAASSRVTGIRLSDGDDTTVYSTRCGGCGVRLTPTADDVIRCRIDSARFYIKTLYDQRRISRALMWIEHAEAKLQHQPLLWCGEPPDVVLCQHDDRGRSLA